MILYIISWSIIYFILIFVLHYLFLYFQKNLTTTKTKDYYNFPQNEYDKINDILNTSLKKEDTDIPIEKVPIISGDIQPETIQSVENIKIGTTITENYRDMQNELEQYLNEIK
mgnify:CR=1 FL=1|jgi:hypothetical protein